MCVATYLAVPVGLARDGMYLAVGLSAVVAIIARFTWVFPAIYVPRWLSKSLAARDPAPTWHAAFVVAFTGIRGVVSLAAALGLPRSALDEAQTAAFLDLMRAKRLLR